MRRPRVLIVDDSVVIRRLLSETLTRDPNLEVAGAASNGRVALMKIPLLRPDVVALDVEMPEMGGVETLAAIRRAYPHIAVILLADPNDQAAADTLDALTLGAKDYVTKPEIGAGSEDAVRSFSDELALKISLYGAGLSREPASVSPPRRARSTEAPRSGTAPGAATRVDVLVIGVSTGGPGALMDLVPRFPADFPVPILIVQHMPPMFTRLLAERLAAKCRIRVAEGRVSETLAPGTAWIAPGDFHMSIVREGEVVRIHTHQGLPENSCRPAADVLFRSAARVYGPHVLAVVMTGMGQDGFRGCEHIHAAGGQVLVQDEASSVVWGMPGVIVRAGMADQVLPLEGLGPEIIDRVSRYRDAARATDADPHVRMG